MNKYRFNYDEKTGEYHLAEKQRTYCFSPRVFAQNFFYKMGEVEQTNGQLIFKSGAEDEIVDKNGFVEKQNRPAIPYGNHGANFS